jgi:hypothetical protein
VINHYEFVVKNNHGSVPGQRLAGLTPTFLMLRPYGSNVDVTFPTIHEIGQGKYYFDFDAEVAGECTVLIDAGAGSGLVDGDRYIDGQCLRDSGRIQNNLHADGTVNATVTSITDKTGYQLSPNGLDGVQLPADITDVSQVQADVPYALAALVMRLYNEVLSSQRSVQVKNNAGSVFANMDLNTNNATATKGKAYT